MLDWLLTYAAHSTLLLAGAWLLSIRLRSHAVRETLWKTALFGAFLTATAQVVLGVTPLPGRGGPAPPPPRPVWCCGAGPPPRGGWGGRPPPAEGTGSLRSAASPPRPPAPRRSSRPPLPIEWPARQASPPRDSRPGY